MNEENYKEKNAADLNSNEENKSNVSSNNQTKSNDNHEELDEHLNDFPVPPQSDEDKISSLTAELESVNAKLTETHDKMLRIAANADNTRKRLEKEKSDAYLYSIQEFAKDLLPVIDSFDKALHTIDQSETNTDNHSTQVSSIIEGVRMVSKIFDNAIKKHGIERLPGKDSAFNPSFHNAIAKETDSKYKSEVVIEEYMSGYKIADRVLRTALVKVGSPD